jgi:RNA polymerase sigma-70 factor (ECF subfamily)
MTENTPVADRYTEWDAAYVLGSLSPAERLEFEAHLATCDRCAAAVAELAGMPGLLGRVRADDAFALIADEDPLDAEPEPDLVPVLLEKVRHRGRVRRRWTVGIAALAVAAAVVAAVMITPMVVNPAPPPTVSAQLSQTVTSPLSADVHLTSEKWGTRIDMSCSYGAGGEWKNEGPVRYALWVTDTSGTSREVSSWSAGPGSTVTPTATIDTPIARISSVDVRAVSTGTVLLRTSLLPAAN